MLRAKSSFTSQVLTVVGSISTVCSLIHVTFAPNDSNNNKDVATSLMFGIFSIWQGSSANKVAGKMATTAFLAPLISTAPDKRTPPLILYFLTIQTPLIANNHSTRAYIKSALFLRQTDHSTIRPKNYTTFAIKSKYIFYKKRRFRHPSYRNASTGRKPAA